MDREHCYILYWCTVLLYQCAPLPISSCASCVHVTFDDQSKVIQSDIENSRILNVSM